MSNLLEFKSLYTLPWCLRFTVISIFPVLFIVNLGDYIASMYVDGSKTGLVMKKKKVKQKSTTGIGTSLTPDYREQEGATKM